MENKVLDLSVYQQNTLDITMPDGSIIKVKKPTQKIVIQMVSVGQVNQENQAAVLEALCDVCAAILSNNTTGKAFTTDWVADNLDMIMIHAIVKAYADYTQELQNNPF